MLELVLALLVAVGCDVDQQAYLRWGAPDEGQVYTEAVPTGKVWIVRGAGVFGTNYPGEYMLQLETLTPAGFCCWKVPLARTPGFVTGTPYLALGRTLVMHEGEKLSARVNGLHDGRNIGINMTYYEVPKTCLGEKIKGMWHG